MSPNGDNSKRLSADAIIFDVLLFGFFLLLAIISLNYNPRARAIPFALGMVGSFMMLVQFLVDAFPPVRKRLRFIGSSGLLSSGGSSMEKFRKGDGPLEGAASEEISSTPARSEPEKVWWQIFRITLWLVAFVLLLAYTSYLLAVGAFIVLVTKFEKGESWKRSVLLGLCVDMGFFVLFDVLLKAQL